MPHILEINDSPDNGDILSAGKTAFRRDDPPGYRKQPSRSPLDVGTGLELNLARKEIVDYVHEVR